MSNKCRTLADIFCEIYVERDENPRRGGYISISPILVNHRYKNHSEHLFVSHSNSRVFERDGFPVHPVRTRYCNALLKCGDNVCRLYNTLNQVFTEDAIKLLFSEPNIWLLNKNYLARKRNRTEINEFNRKKKLMGRHDFNLHNACVSATANRSASQHMRYIRKLQQERTES